VIAFGYHKFALIGFGPRLAEPLVEIIRVETDKISTGPPSKSVTRICCPRRTSHAPPSLPGIVSSWSIFMLIPRCAAVF
jgi:hypothetical protein